MSEAREDHEGSGAYHALTLGVFLSSFAFFCVTPVLPLFVSDMTDGGATGFLIGAIVSASFFTSAIASPIWGALGDRVGPKRMLLRSAFGLALTYVLTGLAPTTEWLFAARLLNGLMAGFVPAALTILSQVIPKERLGRAMVRANIAKALGSVGGAAAGGFVGAWLGFFAVFVAASAAMLLAALFAVIFVPTPAAAAGAAPSSGKKRPLFESIRAGAADLPTRRVLLCMFVITCLLSTLQPVIPIHLVKLTGSEAAAASLVGLAFGFGGAATILFGSLWGILADRVGARRVIVTSMIGGGAVLIGQFSITQSLAFMICFGIYAGLLSEISALLNASLARVVPDQARNSAFGLSNTSSRIALTAGPMLGGALLDPLGSHYTIVVVGCVLIASALLCRLWLPPDTPTPNAEP